MEKPFKMPLLAENDFLPILTPSFQVAKKAKIMFINYPNNPTSATASLKFFEEVVDFGGKEQNYCHS